MLTVDIGDALRPAGGGDHGFARGHGLDNLDPYATATEQGDDVDLLGGDELHGVRHLAHHVDPRQLEGQKVVRHATARQMEGEGGHAAVDKRPHLVKEPTHTLLVGEPVHGTEMEEGVGLLGLGGGRSGVYGKGDGDDGLAASLGTEVVGIDVGNADDAVEVVDMLALVGSEGEGKMLDVPPLEGVALALSHAAPYMVLHIVGTKEERRLAVAADNGHVRGQEDAFEMDDVELFLAEQLRQPRGKGLADKTAYMVGVGTEQSKGGIEGMDGEVDVDRFEACGLAVGVGDAATVDRREGRFVAELEYLHRERVLLGGQGLEAFTHNLGTVDNVDKGRGIEVAEVGTELDKVGTLHGDVDNLALGAIVKALAGDAGATTVEFVEDVFLDNIVLVGDDEGGFVALDAVDNEVDDLAFDKDDNDGVDGETDVAKGDKGGEGDAAVDDGDEGAEANLSVLVENHGDDVAATTGGAAAERC